MLGERPNRKKLLLGSLRPKRRKLGSAESCVISPADGLRLPKRKKLGSADLPVAKLGSLLTFNFCTKAEESCFIGSSLTVVEVKMTTLTDL